MMKETFADQVLAFYYALGGFPELPGDLEIINPYQVNSETCRLAEAFYRKFYSDTGERYLIIGINPGRFGGAVTGVPFTDPKRYTEKCGLPYKGVLTHEPSSVFVYEMIDAFGGSEAFYRKFFINSVFPLALTYKGKNYNYYDSRELSNLLQPAIIENLKNLSAMHVRKDVCFCLGKKNYEFLQKLNQQYHFFEKLISLEHPRYIVQYKSREKEIFIGKYLAAFQAEGIVS